MEENKTEEKKPEAPQPAEHAPSPSSDSALPGPAWLFYAITIVIPGLGPLMGIIMGIIYMTKDNAVQKKFGKTLLILGIVFGVVIPCICWLSLFGFSLISGGGNVNYNASYGY